MRAKTSKPWGVDLWRRVCSLVRSAVSTGDPLVRRIERLIVGAVPAGSTIAAISKGDDRLVTYADRTGWHFPEHGDGAYAGYHPEDSAAAIAHLEAVRERGATHLLVPCTSFWWLAHYTDFAAHLASRYHVVAFQDDTCVIFSLSPRPPALSCTLPVHFEFSASGKGTRRASAPRPSASSAVAPPTLEADKRPPAEAQPAASPSSAEGDPAATAPALSSSAPRTLEPDERPPAKAQPAVTANAAERGAAAAKPDAAALVLPPSQDHSAAPLEHREAFRDDCLTYHLVGPRSHSRRARVLLYGNVNTNAIDGSSVWLVNVARMLSIRYDVDLLLKAKITNTFLLDQLAAIPAIRILRPDDYPLHMERFGDTYYLTDYSASELVAKLDMENDYRFVMCRGREVGYYLSLNPLLNHKLVAYFLMDYHKSTDSRLNPEIAMLQTTVWNARVVLAQTEMMRDFMRSAFDCELANIFLLPPMVAVLPPEPGKYENRNNLCLYAGKFDVDWRIPDILELCKETATPLQLVGNKFHVQSVDGESLKQFVLRYVDKNDNITYLSAVPHHEIASLIVEADFGISIRSDAFLLSREFSTKVLEFGAHGKPTIVNDSAINRQFLGDDYPLFANTNAELRDALERVKDPVAYARAAEACYAAARRCHVTTVARVCDQIEERLQARPDTRRALVIGDDRRQVHAVADEAGEKTGASVMKIFYAPIRELRHDSLIRPLMWAEAVTLNVSHELPSTFVSAVCASGRPIIDSRAAGRPALPDRKRRSGRLRQMSGHNGTTPTFSVIVPSWNTPPPLLTRALDSVLGQDGVTESDVEVILVDDASDVPVSSTLTPVYLGDPRIRVVRNTSNKGLGLSRNLGFERARGSFIAFLDADDYLDAKFLSSMAQALETHDVVIGKMVVHFENDDRFDHDNYVADAVMALREGQDDPMSVLPAVSACVKCYRRTAMERGRLFFHIGYHEDIYPWVRFAVCRPEFRIGHAESAVYFRTIRATTDQITQDPELDGQRLPDLHRARQMVIDLLQMHNSTSRYDGIIARYERLLAARPTTRPDAAAHVERSVSQLSLVASPAREQQ